MATDYDIIVIGAGPGGATCAALLAKKGLRVALLDKNSRVGGKMMDNEVNGAHGEMWASGGLPVPGPWVDTYKALDMESKLEVSFGTCAAIYRGPGMKWSDTHEAPYTMVISMEDFSGTDPEPLFDTWKLNREQRDKCLEVLAELWALTPEQIDKLEDITVKDWFAQRPDIPDALYRYIAYIFQVEQEGVPDLLPMSVIHAMLHEMQVPLGYPKGGYGHMVEDIAGAFKRYGGEFIPRSRVERIMVDKGWATGVVTRDAVYRAPVVVSSAGIQPTVLKLVGEECFDKSFVSRIKSLTPSLGFNGVRYVLREPVLDHPLYQIWSENSWWDLDEYLRIKAGGAPKDVTISAIVATNYDPKMGPPGKQVVLFGTNCSPDTRDDAVLKAVTGRCEEQFLEIFPEVKPVIESKEYAGPREVAALSRDATAPGTGGEFALAINIGQTGKYKPKAESPIPGLFFAGFDAGSHNHLVGSNAAVDSGINVAKKVYEYYLGRKFTGW